MSWNRHYIRSCSNLACTNKIHEGNFVIMTTHELTDGSVIKLLLCVPCAENLISLAK